MDVGLPGWGNLKGLEQVYDSFFELLEGKDFSGVAIQCGSDMENGRKLVLKYFGKEIIIDVGSSKVYYREDHEEIDILSAAIILHYITTADGTALTGNWISYRELPDGMFYFRTIPGVLRPLLDKYGESFESMAEKVEKYGGRKSSDFKNGTMIYPFVYFPILLILEEKGEEFEADIRVLFDSSASHYMKTDIVKVLLVNIVKALLR